MIIHYSHFFLLIFRIVAGGRILKLQLREDDMKLGIFLNRFCMSLVAFLSLSCISISEVYAGLSQDEKVEIGLEVTKLFRASRGVIAKNQALINDPDKGDKGLSADAVIAGAKENYKAASGKDFAQADKSTPKGQAQAAMLDAVQEVMDNAQALINQKGKGLKGFLPAIYAKQVADSFSKRMEGKAYLKLTAPKSYVRNRANRPDEWEDSVIENSFKKPGYEKDKPFVETASLKGRSALRLILPEYYAQSCLNCHGEPKGEKDVTGGKKEGGKLGELGGAISFALYE